MALSMMEKAALTTDHAAWPEALAKEFERERVLASDWYRERLEAKRRADQTLWQRHIKYLQNYCAKQSHTDVVERLKLLQRLKECRERLQFCDSNAYLERIQGTLGVDPKLSVQDGPPSASEIFSRSAAGI